MKRRTHQVPTHCSESDLNRDQLAQVCGGSLNAEEDDVEAQETVELVFGFRRQTSASGAWK